MLLFGWLLSTDPTYGDVSVRSLNKPHDVLDERAAVISKPSLQDF